MPYEDNINTSGPILHIITNLEGNAGAEIMLSRLLRISGDEKIVVVPLINVSDQNRKRADNPRVSFEPLHIGSAKDGLSAIPRLARLIARERPRAVICWMYHAMIAGTLAQKMARSKAPLFWNVRQSLDDPASLSRNTRLAVRLAKLLSRSPTGIIYNSERAMMLHAAYGYANSNTIAIPNGFEIPPDVSVSPHAPTVFGIAGRFHPQKDYGNFFQAASQVARRHPHVKFKVAGNGLNLRNEEVGTLLRNTGFPLGSLELCGEVSDMPGFYKGIDLFVLSSRTEGFPNVVAEAMSYGKPAIATDVGDAAKIIGTTGWVVPARDSGALSSAMETALSMSAQDYLTAGTAARARIVEEYGIVGVKRRYEDFVCCGAM